MHKTLLVFNPSSDRGRAGQKASDLRAIIDEMGGADWRGTDYPAHATEIVAEVGHRYETVAALGGDGTVHEVINGLMRLDAAQRPQLGVVPIGSGNDFAVGFGLTMNPLEAIKRVFTGAPKPVDVAQIKDGAGRVEYFDNTCGIGFDAAVNIRSRKITRLYGFIMYLTATLQTIALNFDAPHMKVAHDGGSLDQRILMLTVGNGPREGGGFITTPASKMDDGLLDFVYIEPVSQFRMLQLLPKVMNATHIHEPDVHVVTTRKLVIDAERALPIHTDGELWAPYEADVRHVEIAIAPGAVRVLV